MTSSLWLTARRWADCPSGCAWARYRDEAGAREERRRQRPKGRTNTAPHSVNGRGSSDHQWEWPLGRSQPKEKTMANPVQEIKIDDHWVRCLPSNFGCLKPQVLCQIGTTPGNPAKTLLLRIPSSRETKLLHARISSQATG